MSKGARTRFSIQYTYSVLPDAVHERKGVLPGTLVHIRDISIDGYPRSAGVGPLPGRRTMLCNAPTYSPHDMVNAPTTPDAYPANICKSCAARYAAVYNRNMGTVEKEST